MVRAIRWLRLWRGHPAGSRDDNRDRDITFGQRLELVRRGVAAWDEPEHPEPPKQKKRQRESAVDVQ